MKQVYVIAYDIVSDKKRRKAAETLQDYGLRMQKSVFECVLDRRALGDLKRKLSAIIDGKEDSVLFYALCQACEKRQESLGLPPIRPEKEFDIL